MFAFLKAMREAEVIERSLFYIELCDIVAVQNCGVKYARELKKVYFDRIKSISPVVSMNPVYDAADPNTAALLLNALGQSNG
jgi:hypothetical protein